MKVLTKIVSLALLGSVLALALPAQQPKIVSKQEQANRAFKELTERMQKLQVTLAKTDPDKAEVLGLGTRYIQEKGLDKKMAEIKELLQGENWDEALDTCKKVIKDLDTLIDLLLKGDTRIEDLLREIARLEAFKNRVENLIKDQQKEKDDSARREALENLIKDLERAKQDIDDILSAQKDLRSETNAQGLSAAPNKAAEMSKDQGSLKDRTEKLSQDLKQLEESAKDLDGAGAAGKPGEGKPGEGKPGEGQPGEGGSPSKGSASASSAAQSMGQAQNKLSENKPESSLEDMDKAIDKLEKAKKAIDDELDEKKRELLKLAFEQLAKEQEKTRIETDKLAKDMEKSEQGESGDGSDGKPTPGKDNVQQAVPKQKSAAGSLKDRKPGKAKQDQQDAKEDLEAAKRKLDEALAQLRQQLQDEVLRSLEERFGAMLAKQKQLSARTRVSDRLGKESLTAEGVMPKELVDRCNRIATGEFELAAEANGALKLLEEDGTTAVFPDFVVEVRDDLKEAGRRLQRYKTGKATQAMQKEIEEMLEMLIDALRQQIEENENNGGEP